MSNFEKRVDSKVRINDLEKEFTNTIVTFSNKHPELTTSEVSAVMLRLLKQANDGEIDESIK